jgi:1-acyl-sn-glycerol-3-phosphate acyltransferase
MLRTVLVLAFLPLYAILATLVGYPVARLVGSPAPLYALGRFGSRIALLLCGVRTEFEGVDSLQDERNLIVMPNHTSHLDAAILVLILPTGFKAVVKRELYGFPLVHYCFRLAGFIDVDRKNKAQSQQAVGRAVAALKAGSCFLLFPEGTRSPDGMLQPFKKGGFVVALEAGSRIVPVAISGAAELMPKGRFRIRPGTVRVQVLDPVDAGRYSYDQRDLLIEDVRVRIAAALAAPAIQTAMGAPS